MIEDCYAVLGHMRIDKTLFSVYAHNMPFIVLGGRAFQRPAVAVSGQAEANFPLQANHSRKRSISSMENIRRPPNRPASGSGAPEMRRANINLSRDKPSFTAASPVVKNLGMSFPFIKLALRNVRRDEKE